MEQTLLLESFTHNNKEYTTKLVVGDDGNIYLKLPESCHTLVSNEVEAVGDMTFLLAYIHEGSRSKMLTPVKDSKEGEVRDFFRYWTDKRLLEVKNKKWDRFNKYLNHVLGFVKDNIDVDRYKPTYRTVYHDHRDYGGDEANNIEILVSWGVSWKDDFDKCWDLSEKLFDEQIDRSMGGVDEDYWFGNVRVSFRPVASDTCDFVAFD